MGWIPGSELRYFNPQQQNIASEILGQHSAFANAGLADRVGIENSRRDDIPSAWDNLRPPPVTMPKIGTGSIVTPPESNMILAKELRRVASEQAAAKAAQEAGNG